MDGDDGIVWYLRGFARDLGSVVVLTLEGRVSSATLPTLSGLLDAQRRPDLRGMVIDLSGVDYINGAGLGILAAAAAELQAADTELVICGLQSIVQTSLDIAGPIPHLTIEPSADAAVSRLIDRGLT